MGHNVIPEISKKSDWWIPAYRFLELKYFCLQYPDWKREAAMILSDTPSLSPNQNGGRSQIDFRDPTASAAIRLRKLNSKISLVGEIAEKSDNELGGYVLKAVTEGLSFITLKTIYDIPCGRDMYYDRFRKFFFILSLTKE